MVLNLDGLRSLMMLRCKNQRGLAACVRLLNEYRELKKEIDSMPNSGYRPDLPAPLIVRSIPEKPQLVTPAPDPRERSQYPKYQPEHEYETH